MLKDCERSVVQNNLQNLYRFRLRNKQLKRLCIFSEFQVHSRKHLLGTRSLMNNGSVYDVMEKFSIDFIYRLTKI